MVIQSNLAAMPPHWISAKTALAIFAEVSGDALARMALCRGAHLGVIKTRAITLSIDGKVMHEGDLPKKFWWAEGHEALEQDWNLGDFETWNDHKVRWQARGVEFDFNDIRDSLDSERAAMIARQLSVAGNADWMTAKAARSFMCNDMGAQPVRAGALLIAQCQLGFVAARAVLWRQTAPERPDDWEVEERECDIPQWFWAEFCGADNSTQDWELGTFAGRGRSPRGLCWISLNAVHFSRASIGAMKDDAPGEKSATIKPRPAGRPPAAFWDDLSNNIWGRIFRGEFQPQRQADIERAMLDWAIPKGHELSVTTARERARKLWTEYRSEGENR